MEVTHIVQQGEYMSRIAEQYGFPDWKVIYDHPKNKDLKEKRPNPNLLFPGDRVIIPQKEYKELNLQTGKGEKIKVKTSKTLFRVRLKGVNNKPLKNSRYTLQLGDDQSEGTTDGDGVVEHLLPTNVRRAVLKVSFEDALGSATETCMLNIGDMDPVDEFSGQRARLTNLGYDAEGAPTKDDPRFLRAVEEFQCDNKLKVDGDCGPKTQSKLKEVYGL